MTQMITSNICLSLCAYSLTAQQTATAPRDAPWLLLTGTARWPGAKTHKHAHTHSQKRNIYSSIIIQLPEGPCDSVQWTKCTYNRPVALLLIAFPGIYQYWCSRNPRKNTR